MIGSERVISTDSYIKVDTPEVMSMTKHFGFSEDMQQHKNFVNITQMIERKKKRCHSTVYNT